MVKKLIMACLVLAVLAALALPATASAIQIGETVGSEFKELATKSLFTGTNVGRLKFVNSSLGVITECPKAVLTGEVSNNGTSGEVVEANVTTATVSGEGAEANGMKECIGESSFGSFTLTTNGNNVDGENIANGTPWCVKTIKGTDEFQVTGGLCKTEPRSISLIMDTTVVGVCTYSRAEAMKGSFTTHETGDALLTFKSGANSTFTKTAGGVFCPTSFSLEVSFTLETDSGTVTPLYIKK